MKNNILYFGNPSAEDFCDKKQFFTSLRRSGKMSETMPQTRLAMLEISGKPQAKPSTYGLVGGFNPS